MKIKAIKLKKQVKIPAEKDREVKWMIIEISLFACGMIIGAGIIKNYINSDFCDEISAMFEAYTLSGTSKKLHMIFIDSFAVNIFYVATAFLSGVSCFGIPAAFSLPIIKGLGMGILGGYLYSNYDVSGIGFYLLTVFPGAVISVAAILVASNLSCFMSADILSVVLGKKQSDKTLMENYCKKFLIISLAALAASVTDSLLTKAFSYLFRF